MKYLLIILFLFSTKCFCQNKTEYQLDENISVILPENYTINDTLGVKAVSATIDNRVVIAMKLMVSDTSILVKNDDELKEQYKGIRQGVIATGAKITDDEYITINDLIFSKFSVSFENNEFKDICFGALYLNHSIYSFQVWQLEPGNKDAINEFFSSIKFAKGLSRQNQYDQ